MAATGLTWRKYAAHIGWPVEQTAEIHKVVAGKKRRHNDAFLTVLAAHWKTTPAELRGEEVPFTEEDPYPARAAARQASKLLGLPSSAIAAVDGRKFKGAEEISSLEWLDFYRSEAKHPQVGAADETGVTTEDRAKAKKIRGG